MKFLIAAVSLALIAGSLAVTDEEKAQAKQLAEHCMKETGTSEESVKRLRNGDTSDADDNTKCFVQCFFQGAGFVDADGNIQEDHLTEKLASEYDREKAEELVQKCKNNAGANPCERSFALLECYIENRASLV
ncbi:general odorant-binding protein 56d-like [Uranotaenia lowii]|uniref:general odorant-binding protein 56d-like n=1 Tax=Uranotaenia lowii TaxID=190385 RepID=UPI00247A59CB|nr:general odorant-binding protein 56d-like [Uranotaenia lowii]